MEFAQFWNAAWTFGDACRSVKVLRHGCLSGITPTKCVPLVLRHVARVIAVTMGPHGHNGPGAAEVVLIVDGDDGSFPCTVLLKGA